MPRLTVRLFEPMKVTLSDGREVAFPYEKVRALLAYLVLNADRSHLRSRIAGLLWPEQPEPAARHSLSQALSLLRHAIGDRDLERPHLLITRDSLRFDPESDCWIDVREFRALLAGCDLHQEMSQPDCSGCDESLLAALALTDGLLLDSLQIDDSEEFERWLSAEQDAVRRELQTALARAIEFTEAVGRLQESCDCARRLTALDTWNEPAQRTLIRLLAASGKRAAAIHEYQAFREILERDLGLEPEQETVDLFERIRSGLEGPRPTDASASADDQRRSNLPEQSTAFIARDEELQHLRALLTDSESSRLITLTGIGGIGKTRLAVQAAGSVIDSFRDGIWFVSLAGESRADDVPSAVIAALPTTRSGEAEPLDQLISFFYRRQSLLLLDNFEDVLRAAPTIAKLVSSCPALTVLVTSRERLNLSAETVFEVRGLGLPEAVSTSSIARSGATRLFVQRARQNRADFLPGATEAQHIFRICQLTGGMPLAIELAAAWVPSLSLGEIAQEIERSFDVLTTRMRDVPARHRSIRAVIDRTWQNLTDIERRAFRRLAVFRGGFSRDAAYEVTGTTLPMLSALVEKSLIHRNLQGRYQIHELLLQYAAEKLESNDAELTTVRDSHCRYYLSFLRDRTSLLEGANQPEALKEVNLELGNIRLAWRHATDTQNYSLLSSATQALWLHYEICSRYGEGVELMRYAHDRLEQQRDNSEAARRALVRVSSRLSALSFRMHGPAPIDDLLPQLEPLAHELGDDFELGMIFNFMATGAHDNGNFSDAERSLALSIDHFTRAGHSWGRAYSTNDLGQLRLWAGDFVSARKHFLASLSIFEELGDRRGIAFALRNLGLVNHLSGDSRLALELLELSTEYRRAIGNQWGVSESLKLIGRVLRAANQPKAARESLLDALQIARDSRSMPLAREILEEYLALLEESGSPNDIPANVRARMSAGVLSESSEPNDGSIDAIVNQILLDHVEARTTS